MSTLRHKLLSSKVVMKGSKILKTLFNVVFEWPQTPTNTLGNNNNLFSIIFSISCIAFILMNSTRNSFVERKVKFYEIYWWKN